MRRSAVFLATVMLIACANTSAKEVANNDKILRLLPYLNEVSTVDAQDCFELASTLDELSIGTGVSVLPLDRNINLWKAKLKQNYLSESDPEILKEVFTSRLNDDSISQGEKNEIVNGVLSKCRQHTMRAIQLFGQSLARKER